MKTKNSNLKFLGVVNITPDSFSDGGQVNSPELVLEKTREHYKKGASAFDFGAESTAPMNPAISGEEELKRFEELLFPVIGDITNLRKPISIDTYKPEVFKAVAEKIYSVESSAELIWNDVSGSVDQSLIETLEVFPHIKYVLSHNLAPKRSLTSRHMEYQSPRLDLEEFFKTNLKELSFHENILLDPCFGFSKNFEQNWELIKYMPDLASYLKRPLVLGVSRKSFFKALTNDYGAKNDLSYRENLHSLVLSYWAQNLPQGSYFIRLHDVAVGQLALQGQQLLT